VKTPEVSKDMTVLVPGQMAPTLPTQEEPAGRRKRKISLGDVCVYLAFHSCINEEDDLKIEMLMPDDNLYNIHFLVIK